MEPGVQITSRAARGARGTDSDNGAWFVTGFAEMGPTAEAVEISSLDDFEDTFGERVSYSQLWDALELFFAEGGATAFVSRVVGPSPVKATKTLVDRAGTPVNTLRIDAISYGDWANGSTGGLSVTVVNGTGTTFTIIIELNGVEVERYTDLASPSAAVTALATSDYVRAVDLASATAATNNNPVAVADQNLAGGTDDHASAVETQWTAALAYFTKDLGPGQVSAPGRTTTDGHKALITHAAANNRTAYLDVADSASESTMTTEAAALESYPGAEYAGLFGTWVTIPGIAQGTVRSVPGSAYAAGVTARADALEGTSGVMAAGEIAAAEYALDIKTPTGGFTDDDYTDLNDAGVNMTRNFRVGGVQLYGFRSVTDDADWAQLQWTRLRVSLTARLEQIGQRFTFKPASRATFADLNAALTAECLKDYNAGALYGDTPEEAFRVDTGDTVNTADTIAAGEIRANVFGRFAPGAELVLLSVVKVPVTAPV